MSRGRELIKNTAILFIAKVSTQLINFFMLPLYTGFLSTAEYGQLDIYNSLSMILIPFATLQIEQGIFRFLIGTQKRDKIEEVLSSAGITVFVIAGVYSLFFLIASFIFNIQFAVLLYLYYFSMILSTLMYQISRGLGNNKVFGFGSFLISACTVSFNALFIAVFHMKIEGVLISTIISHIIGSIYMIKATGTSKYIKFSKVKLSQIKELLNYSCPLIFNQISSWTINYSDRLIVLVILGMSWNGVYSLANKFSNLLNMFFGVYNLAWTENIVRYYKDKDYIEYLQNAIILTLEIYLGIVIGIINVLSFAFHFFVNSNYNAAYQHIPILLLAMFFSGAAAMLGSIYIAHKMTKSVAITTFFSGLINIIINLGLIYKIGLYAASISTLIAFFFLFVYRYFDIKKFAPIEIKFIEMLPQGLILMFSWIAYYTSNWILMFTSLVFNIGFLFILFKNNFITIKKITSKY